MRSLVKRPCLNFIFLMLLVNTVFNQSFKKNILVNLTGQNYDYDILRDGQAHLRNETYISWINKNDSIYTVYFKKISPSIENNTVISTGREIKSRPRLIYISNSNSIRISWQVYSNHFYKIVYTDIVFNVAGTEVLFKDSISTDPQMELTTKKNIWIDNGNLVYKEFLPKADKIILDSGKCSSPNSLKTETTLNNFNSILYERREGNKNNIYLAQHFGYPSPKWEIKKIMDGEFRNPCFGMYSGASMENIENKISRIAYSYHDLGTYYKTTNNKCNYTTPDIFTYLQVTGIEKNYTPFFITFVSDSIKDDNEIFVKPIGHFVNDSLKNISQMPGNDYLPKICFMSDNDSLSVSILWLHQMNNQIDIWYAKTIYNPNLSVVERGADLNDSFSLKQNYPNPFNPITTINYSIPETYFPSREGNGRGVPVNLKVYDLLGRIVATLVDEYKQPGNYNSQFSTINYQLTSGVYFYTLRAGDYNQTKKMVIMK